MVEPTIHGFGEEVTAALHERVQRTAEVAAGLQEALRQRARTLELARHAAPLVGSLLESFAFSELDKKPEKPLDPGKSKKSKKSKEPERPEPPTNSRDHPEKYFGSKDVGSLPSGVLGVWLEHSDYKSTTAGKYIREYGIMLLRGGDLMRYAHHRGTDSLKNQHIRATLLHDDPRQDSIMEGTFPAPSYQLGAGKFAAENPSGAVEEDKRMQGLIIKLLVENGLVNVATPRPQGW